MTVITGDCLEVMKSFPDNHFSCVVTDPPYGLSFMGKGWDYAVPGKEYWEECRRITKPGGHLIAMGGTRTFHRLATAIEESGYEIRDTIAWIYGSGFPKSHNHFGIEGYGTALKPAYEPIIMAMKPCDGTFKQNTEKWGQAGINIDGCRIGFGSDKGVWPITDRDSTKEIYSKKKISQTDLSKGRWPANVILDEEAGRLLDEQSGILKSGGGIKNPIGMSTKGFMSSNWRDSGEKQPDTGGASRFFYCAKASSSERNEGLDGLLKVCKPLMGEFKDNPGRKTPKSSPTARQNHHPTVKPLKLMEYLIKLVMPPKDGLLLDPFAGSGTTILAAKRLGFDAIGIEKSEEYSEIARKRIESFRDLFTTS